MTSPERSKEKVPNGSNGLSRRYRNDPLGFVNDVLSASGTPYAKQEEMFQAAATNRRVSVVGCNGSGKDWAAARIVLWWIGTRSKAKAIVTGPTQRQVEEVVWREMRIAHGVASGLRGQMYTARYVINDERFALGFSTDHPYNLQGFHSPNLLVVVTEAHAVAQERMDALKRLNPRLLVLTGNPLTLSGEFYDSHHTKRELYACIGISAYDTPNVQEEREDVKPGMTTLQDIEERRKEWGEENPMYKASVLGEFPEALEDTLISLKPVTEAVARWTATSADSDLPCYMGVDVARFGSDKTVFCLRRGNRVEQLWQLIQADTMQVVGRVVDLVRERQVQAVFVDAVGVGGGVVDRLRELGQPVVEVQVGSRSRNPERFLNKRSEVFWALRRRFLDGEIAIPNDAELIGQVVGLRYDFTSSGLVQIEDKGPYAQPGNAVAGQGGRAGLGLHGAAIVGVVAVKAPAELAALLWALGLAPLGPVLAVTYVGLGWQVTTMGGVWAVCWYVWLWSHLTKKEEE